MKLPDGILKQHIAVLGKTGSGKSSAMRLLVEGLLEEKKPVCIIDPKGDWWGLKLSADGKSAGFPVVIFGGEHADVPINAHSGKAVAELIATGNRSCIIDLGGWMVGDRTRFFIDFAQTLFTAAKGPRWLVIDEVHNFAPQGKVYDPDAGKMLHWANRLASEGRGKGITTVTASQRPQKVHKDFLTCAETLIAMRLIHPLDRQAIKDWMDGAADASRGAEVLKSLAEMKRGEGWVWSPEIGYGPVKYPFPKFSTYDSFSPQTAAQAGNLKGWAEVDLEEVKSKLAAVIEEKDANDPKALKARVAELERAASKAQTALPAKMVEVSILSDAHAATLGLIMSRADGLQEDARLMGETMAAIRREVSELRGALVGRSANPMQAPHHIARPVTPSRGTRLPSLTAGESIPKGERRILVCIAQNGSADREQLTVSTGYKRSSRDAYLQRLREKGMIAISGDTITATDDGLSALGDFESLPTGEALRNHWIATLPTGEGLILQLLIEAYPEAMTRDAISERTEYQRSSRDAYLQRLNSRKLIETSRGEVRASSNLFE